VGIGSDETLMTFFSVAADYADAGAVPARVGAGAAAYPGVIRCNGLVNQ